MQNPYVKWGLIGALFAIVLTLIGYLINSNLVVSGVLSWIVIPVIILCAAKAALEERSLNGGYIGLGRAFGVSLLTITITLLVISLFNLLLFNVIDPELNEMRIEKSMEISQSFGGDMGESQMESYYELMNNKIYLFLMEFIGGVFCFGLIPSLVIGLIINKNNPNNDLL